MNWQQYERDLPFITGAAMAINDINAQNQANANYNAVMQGYMSQGYAAEQARAMADEYFRPQWILAQARRERGWMWWCVVGSLFFVWGSGIGFDTQDPGFGVFCMFLAGGLAWLSLRILKMSEQTKAQAYLAQPTAHAGPQAAYSTVACKCGWQHTYVDQQHAEAAAKKHWAAKHAPRGITAQ